MDFQSATAEISDVEKDAIPYKALKPERYKAERMLELSPPEISGMEYADIVNQYNRLEKILSASQMELGMVHREAAIGAEASSSISIPAPAITPKEARAVEEEMKKISTQSAKEAEEISTFPEAKPMPEAAAPPAPIPEEWKEEAEPEPAGRKPQEKSGPLGVEEEKEEEPVFEKEESAEGEPEFEKELPPAPARKEPVPHPREVPTPPKEKALPAAGLSIEFPQALAASPLKKADETISRLEAQLGAQMTGKATKKVDSEATKKRMIELTRELFKERSMDRRAEIKKEIVVLKSMLAGGKEGKVAEGGLPKGSLFASLQAEQQFELKEAKNKIQDLFESNQKRLVVAMEAQRAIEHREPAFDSFSRKMVEMEHLLAGITDKYQAFLVAKHAAELEKLKAKGQSTEEAENMRKTLRDEYAHEFSSLKSSIGEEIHSQLETTREMLFESAGDPKAIGVSQIATAPEEGLFNLLQARDPRTYEKYARGEINRAEALLVARRIMAKDAGIDEDTINKRFGGK